MFQNLGIWQKYCPDFCQAKPSPEKSALLDIGGFFGRAKSRDKIEAKNQILEYFGYIKAIIMNEYDKRQLDLMIQKIHAFKEGTLYFSSLINDLDALLRALTFEDQEWKNNFSGYWFDLEQVYAVALDENRTHFDSEDQKIVREAIQNLEMMVNNKLEIYGSSRK